MSGAPEITHAVYKAIKHYNRAQLAQFCTNLYMNGYNDGNTEGIDADRVFAVISGVRGIGPKRLAAIKAAVNGAFGEKEGKAHART